MAKRAPIFEEQWEFDVKRKKNEESIGSQIAVLDFRLHVLTDSTNIIKNVKKKKNDVKKKKNDVANIIKNSCEFLPVPVSQLL